MLFWADYYLRWWRLPIEEHACLGGGDYYLRNSGLPPLFSTIMDLIDLCLHIIFSYTAAERPECLCRYPRCSSDNTFPESKQLVLKA